MSLLALRFRGRVAKAWLGFVEASGTIHNNSNFLIKRSPIVTTNQHTTLQNSFGENTANGGLRWRLRWRLSGCKIWHAVSDWLQLGLQKTGQVSFREGFHSNLHQGGLISSSATPISNQLALFMNEICEMFHPWKFYLHASLIIVDLYTSSNSLLTCCCKFTNIFATVLG